jgi:hypothetical protein
MAGAQEWLEVFLGSVKSFSEAKLQGS